MLGLPLVLTGGVFYYAITPHHTSAPPESAEGVLDTADTLAWGNRWTEAQPLYVRAQRLFEAQHQRTKALYAEVSQIPPNESVSIPGTILRLTEDLAAPAAQDPETKLRILTIRGMLEINYDAAEARATWQTLSRQRKRL